MTFRFPGSLVNRALRSRLLTAQQYRANIASQRLPQTWIVSSDHRRYTSSYSSSHSRSFDRDSDARRIGHVGDKHFKNRQRNRREVQDVRSRDDHDILMAIASGSFTGRYNSERETADSDALDPEAAETEDLEKDPYDYEDGESEVQENGLPGDQASKERDLEADVEADSADGEAPENDSYRGPIREMPKLTPKIINEELKWLNDPRKMADRVARILHSGNPALAAALVRAGTKQGLRCDVAWNHLLQYCMDQNHPQAAFKFYNDMKKRGRRPTPRTYTIMLKGFSSAPRSLGVAKTAASVYRSIGSPNSGVKLDIIHTNAMLTVCHRHWDMDRLWKIAGELPEEGPGAPDATTYTIILNAVQFAARRDIEKMSPDEIEKILERKAQVITEGKRIWADVIWRWKNQTLKIDNELVNGMASLLLEGGSDIDCYNVMELYKQTMGVPILQKRPTENEKTTRRRITPEQSQALEVSEATRQSKMEDVPFVDENNRPIQSLEPVVELEQDLRDELEEVEEEEVEEEEEEDFAELFKPVVPQAEELSFLEPNSKELTLILNACFTMTQGSEGGQAYWKHMTLEDHDYRIDPDTFTYIQYFRLLRISRSSKISVKTMREQMVPSGQATGTAFHVALSVCRRDRRNHSVLQHANELIALMDKALILPDIRVLDGYLEMIQILSTNPSVLLHLRGLDTEDSKTSKPPRLHEMGRKLQAKLRLAAIAALRPYILQLHEAMENGKPELRTRWSALQNTLSDSVAGSAAVKIMSRVRLVVDDTLKLDYKSYVSKAERKALEADSKMLKKYSDKDVIATFKRKKVYPTIQQKEEARERIKKFQWEARNSRNQEGLDQQEDLSS
ncbi:Pentatricopeptide repeat protein [Penicillium digitatum]|uniref:Pentatricopeptide repeat protein n=3 Tax=Penicillium digitatum TaxID=36651 RepID=K9G1W9_PEND2|nr:Pentatricopeptide repeat protein [Penicillium digitatum Pd1]EKV09627.1 Pentatricopeptide repeat protein [Penicillium digitatum Pd1]EKV14867.1 Pentatricopeptide repeat protein [Penicillium digitatum PHI26]QQK44574.1 Pentatricopeptide repeat protein [Penicillium digitatum]